MIQRIFLIGFMGSGKTTYGRMVAKKLGWRFVDMDERIIELTGLSIPEIFSKHGEGYFRVKEAEVLATLCERQDIVVATGGGVPCQGENMEMMNDSGLTVYIKMPPGSLMNRLVNAKTERPLLAGKTADELEQYIIDTLAAREPFYNRAQVVIDGHADVVAHILKVTGPGAPGMQD